MTNSPLQDESFQAMAALHRYWVTADSVKLSVGYTIPDRDGRSERLPRPDRTTFDFQQLSSFYRLMVWYALLYVVIEGYNELKLHDAQIDRELKNTEMVALLRRSRNGSFHFQKDYFSEKLWALYLADESEIWVQNLHRLFGAFFKETVVDEWARRSNGAP